MKILVEMAFSYGTQHFSSGPQECADAAVVRHMVRLGYGTLAKEDVPEETVEVVVPVEEKPVEEKPVRKRTTRKKATKK